MKDVLQIIGVIKSEIIDLKFLTPFFSEGCDELNIKYYEIQAKIEVLESLLEKIEEPNEPV